MAEVCIEAVRKSYGQVEVVHGIDCAIDDGEFAVIVGPSGCGKSTLLRMIAGLEEISDGDISIAGARVNDLEPRERDVAMVFQNYALYPHMTVFRNIAYALKIAKVPKAEIARRVEAVAKTLGLSDYLQRKPGQLSGGQRQRVAMGRAIIREPGVFLFDEPLSNLDAKLRVQMRVEIRRLHSRLKATSVFVTHDQVEAMTMADKLIVMNDGVIEQVGSPAEVYARPATAFVAGFIGSPPMNFLNAAVHDDGRGLWIPDENLRLGLETSHLDLDPGTPVLLGIRPEHIRIAPCEAEDGIPVDLDLVEDLGANRLIHVSLKQHSLIIAVPSEGFESLPPRFSLQLTPHHVHFFDSHGGTRLTASPQVMEMAS